MSEPTWEQLGGAQGAVGPAGPTGPQGPQGIPGVTGAGGGVDYIGNWAAGTAYKKGDVVRYNGNDYMAVNDSTGVTPPATGTSFIPLTAASYGTTFPATPFDGQEHIYPAGASGELWRFRYNAGSASAYKWEFVGGAEVMVSVYGVVAVASLTNTGGWYSDSSMNLILPRAGDYIFNACMNFSVNAAGMMGMAIGRVAPTVGIPDPNAARQDTYVASGTTFDSLALREKLTSAAAGGSYRPHLAGSLNSVGERHFSVIPVRVS